MINIDLSKALPRFGAYLLGIVPGVFFGASVAIANPQLAASVISRLRQTYPFGPYALVFFLASSLFIGQGFMLLAWISELLISFGFAMWCRAIRLTFASERLYRVFGNLQGVSPKQDIFIRFLGRVIFWARAHRFPDEARPVVRNLHVATRQLLKNKYGIDSTSYPRSTDGAEWGVWYAALEKPPRSFREALMASRTFLGCGFAGFAALYTLPTLRAPYFSVLCLIFTFAGLFISVDLFRWKVSPVRRSILRLRSTLSELSEANFATEKDGSAKRSGLVAQPRED